MSDTTIYLPGRIRPVEFDRSKSTGLKKTFKTAQKRNDCQMPLTKDKKYVVLQFLTKCFILGPLNLPQSMVNLDIMITCDWPPSHY